MLPCYGCAYRDGVPGSAHSRCRFAWNPDEMPKGEPHGIAHGWYIFPFNYDPTWGPNECVARSETLDKDKVAPTSPLHDLISILGRRGL